MPSKKSITLTAVVVLALPLAGCSGDSATSSPSTTAGSPSSSGSSPSPSASSPTTPSPAVSSPTPTRASAAPARARTAAELKKALLVRDDMPSGFAVEPETEDDGAGMKASSTKAACSKLVTFFNIDRPPGSKAAAYRSFSGGQNGPYIDETLDAMGSAQAVATLQRNFRAAIRSCQSMTFTIPGQGRSTIAVRELSAPRSGTGPVAVRFTASSGPLDGLEIATVTTGVGDVVLGITVVNGQPEDLAGATADAVEKASKILRVATTGT